MAKDIKLTAKWFNAELEARRLTIGAFSELTGIPLRTVYNYSSGTRRMPRWMPFVLTALNLKACSKED